MEVQTVYEVKNMLTSLQELYVNRMQKVRNSIVLSREYYEGLFAILTEVMHEKEMRFKASHQQDGAEQKQLVIVLSGSRKFAGAVNNEVFNAFREYIKSNICDVIVVGKIGHDLMSQHNISHPFTYYDWNEEIHKDEVISTIAHTLTQYPVVKLFCAQYLNLISQKAHEVDIYEGLEQSASHRKIEKNMYIYEPDKTRVTNFFETRVLEAYLYHTFQELYLALMGSRVFRVEESSTNANRLIKVLEHLEVASRKKKKNKDQLANVSRIMNIKRSYAV